MNPQSYRYPPQTRFPSQAFSGGGFLSTAAGTSDHLTRFERALDAVGLLRGDSTLVYKRGVVVAALGTPLIFLAVPSLAYHTSESGDTQLNYYGLFAVPSTLFLLTVLFV